MQAGDDVCVVDARPQGVSGHACRACNVSQHRGIHHCGIAHWGIIRHGGPGLPIDDMAKLGQDFTLERIPAHATGACGGDVPLLRRSHITGPDSA